MDVFEQLRVSCAKRAWHLAWASTGNETDADDVMQQAFIVAWRRREVIPDEAWPWFATVVVNCARNHRKKLIRMRLRENKLRPSTEDSSKMSLAELSELRERLLDALGELPDGEREAVVLCHMAGLTQKQASGELGIALNTVKSQVKRGLDRLRQRLEPQAGGLEVYLATVAFPPPALGWEAAAQEWRGSAEHSVVNGPPLQRIALTGLVASAAVVVVALVIASLPLSSASPAPVVVASAPPIPSAAPISDHIKSDVSDPLNGGSSESDINREDSIATPAGVPVNVPPATSTVPSLTPPTNERVGRIEVLPPGRNPVGSMQVRTDYYESGLIYTQWTELVTATGTDLHGSYRKFHLDGKVWEVGQFENGLREGSWEKYHENGALACRGEFTAGQVTGLWTWFHDDSVKQAEGSFERGEKHEVWRAWHTNGERRFVKHYENGKRSGLASHYDEQGRKTRETTWLDGVKHGPEIEFDAEGNANPPTIYEHGERH